MSETEALAEPVELDRWLLLVTLLLLGAGLVMVLSASQALAYLLYRSPFYYFERQLMWAAMGLAAMALLSQIDYRYLRPLAFPLAVGAAVAMLVVLVPHIGIEANGARRWLPLGPLGEVQPSEFAKLAFTLYLAHWIDRRGERMKSFFDGFLPLAVLAAAALALTFLQKDLGSALVFAAIFGAAFWTGGGRKRYLILLVLGLAAAFALMVALEPYRLARLSTFLNPFADRLGAGFQSTQALLALGSGGMTGKGLGHSVEKYFWLPEAHTDFIFAIIGEETGLVGTTLVVAGFAVFAFRGYRTALKAPDRFGAVLAAAITTWITFQALLNMGTVTDTIPTTGVTLPFISYGGTSLASSLAAVGVLLSISARGDRPGLDHIWRRNAALDSRRGDGGPPVSRPRGRASVSD